MSFTAKLDADISSWGSKLDKAGKDFDNFASNTQKEVNKISAASAKIIPPSAVNSVNNFSKSMGNANGVAMEFTRIIQDAPFGMMGIGNNIQQLTANFGQLKNQTGSTGAALKQTFASILTSGNLLSLGIAAITSAWTFYTMWGQKAGKETKKTKDEMDELIESLSETSRVMYDAANSTGKETAELNSLYNISQDTAQATNERRDAANRLIKQYPELFGKFTTEQVMLGKAKGAYDTLSSSILATARAQAAYGRIGEKASQQIAIDERNKSLQKEIDLLNTRIDREKASINNTRAAGNAGVGASTAAMAGLAASFEEKRNTLIAEQTTNLLKRASIQENILDLEKVAISNQIAISDGYGLGTEKAKTLKDKTDDLTKSLDEFIQKGRDQKNVFTINENINLKYQEIYDTISKIKNVNPFSVALIGGLKLQEQLDALSGSLSKFGGNDIDANTDFALPEISTDTFNNKANKKFISNITDVAKAAAEAFNNEIKSIIGNGLVDALTGVTDALGDSLMNGGNFLQGAGEALLGTFGGVLKQLGVMVITTSAAFKKIQLMFANPFNPLGPIAGLAAGAALIAIGSVFSAGAKKLGSSGSSGGYASSSSSAQSSFVNDRNTGRYYNNDKQEVTLKLKNGDLVGAIDYSNNRNNRLS